ncbi:hypothetical protein F4861DRAFT_161502 [Xylaria intraflava]|nr:hypothetical protein F4861DRAFT_161502 [Xylaria intraflava]
MYARDRQSSFSSAAARDRQSSFSSTTTRDRQSSISSTGSQYSARNSVFSDISVGSATTLMTVPDIPQGENAPLTRLPCEFVSYGGCDRTFAFAEVDNWIEHMISEHYANNLPPIALCWFCNDPPFDSERDRIDRFTNYDRRMRHIREHLREMRYSIRDIRSDHYLNTHANQAELIPIASYLYVRDYSEVPQGPGIIAHDAVPPSVQARESRAALEFYDSHDTESRRRRRVSGNDGVPQRRHLVTVWNSRGGNP